MIEKNKYMGLEFLFTICLLSISFFMLRDLFWPFGVYVIAALIFGFSFSWLTKRNSPLVVRALVNFCAVIIFIWMIYSLFNSSFFYSEVVLIYLKGMFALEFIFSLVAYLPQTLVYIQILSIPVFMSAPLFAKGYSIFFVILAIGYIICWIAILKTKLYSSVNIIERKGARNYYYIFFVAIMFLAIASISGVFFSKFSLGKHKSGGILPGEAQEEPDSLEGIEKDYYSQLDKVNSKIQQVIPSFKLTQDNRKIVSLFSPLVNESLGIEDVNKIEAGLFAYLSGDNSGLGINDVNDLSALIKRFVDKKAELNLKNIKELILSALMRNTFSLKDKIIGYSLANRMQNSAAYRQIRGYEIKAKTMINSSSVSREIGDGLKDLFRSFREWKNFDIYRKQSGFFMKKIESLDAQTKNKASAIFQELNKAQVPDDFKKIYKKIQDIQSSMPAQLEGAIKKEKELFDLKLELSFLMKSKEVREKIENQSFNAGMIDRLKERIEAVEDTQEPKEFMNNSLNLADEFKKEKTGFFSQLQDLLEIKRYALIREEVLGILEILKNGTFSDSVRSLIASIEELTLEKDPERIIPQISKLEQKLRQFGNNGFINKKAEAGSAKVISNIKQLLLFKINKNLIPEKELKNDIDELSGTLLKKDRILSFIKIKPEVLRINLGEEANFSALGVYSDNSEEDLTFIGNWVSLNNKIATVSKGGVLSFSTGEVMFYLKYHDITSFPAKLIIEPPKLISIVLSPPDSKIFIENRLDLKAEGVYTDSSRQDITELVDWKINKAGLIKIKENKVIPLWFGEVEVHAQYQGLKSLPVNIGVVFSSGWLMGMFLKAAFLVILTIITVFMIFFFLAENTKNKLRAFFLSDQRRFIINLYGQFRIITGIFGLNNAENLPPLLYARQIEGVYSIERDILFKLTEKFEKAKYSRHILKIDDAREALENYNLFLKILFGRYNKFSLFFKYLISLKHKLKLNIIKI